MGVSTDGILFYGIAYGEEELDESQDEFVCNFCNMCGIGESGRTINIGYYCSYEYPMYYICIGDTEHTVSRGSVIRLSPDQFKTDPLWDEELARFCRNNNLPNKPASWCLVSLMG